MTWKCPKCGKPNLMEQTHCNRCGAPRPYNYHHVNMRKQLQIPKITYHK